MIGNRPTIISRRWLCCFIGVWPVNVALSKVLGGSQQESERAGGDQEFFLVNGWVLTRDDLANSDVTFDVVRL
jgi:hypothetical protein